MKHLKSIVKIFVVLLVCVGMPLGAEGKQEATPQKKVTLRLAWWGNPTRDERTLKVVEMYMAQNPHVVIQTETTGWAGYWDKLASQAAANDLPDIIQMDYAYITQYAQKNLLADLTPAVNAGLINLKGVDDNFIVGGKVQGKIYGISLGTNAWCILYDPAILKKAGIDTIKPTWTLEDYEKIANQVYKATGVKTPPFSTTDPKQAFDNMLRQTGDSFFDRATGASLGFTKPDLLIQFYEIQLRLLKSGALVSPDEAFITVTPQESGFAKGTQWFVDLWSNQVIATASAANRPVEIALAPRIANSKRPGTYFKPSMFFSVSNNSKNKEEAAKFINFFVTNIEANKVLLAERGIPIIPAVREELKKVVDPLNKQVFEYIELVGKGNNSPLDPADPPGAGEVLKIFRSVDQEVLYGILDPKAGAEKFMKQANEILAKNKK
ncbi:extracellular solute-binding protein [Treponema sp. J25]|uniref:ABC transporter substrate-binding protein n=1 Tax=Treponema sp. J25 TaxID=2094121 RepID=UPI00104DC604|nr:extracellular solute-binding protein [Treponema sp. J25]TCW62441.1 sugar ABC transporter substrate-binding protein [Treponema sp. J25]